VFAPTHPLVSQVHPVSATHVEEDELVLQLAGGVYVQIVDEEPPHEPLMIGSVNG